MNKEQHVDIFDQFDGHGWGDIPPSYIPGESIVNLHTDSNSNLNALLKKGGELWGVVTSLRRKGKHVGVSGNSKHVTLIVTEDEGSFGNSEILLCPLKPRAIK